MDIKNEELIFDEGIEEEINRFELYMYDANNNSSIWLEFMRLRIQVDNSGERAAPSDAVPGPSLAMDEGRTTSRVSYRPSDTRRACLVCWLLIAVIATCPRTLPWWVVGCAFVCWDLPHGGLGPDPDPGMQVDPDLGNRIDPGLGSYA
ncbi:hypothetical protein AgCh_011828 [Apium graveolens]